MSKHFVYFYGSTKLVTGFNSMSLSSIQSRNQIIGFEGIDKNPELIECGEKCYNKENSNGSHGEPGSMFPKNITIIPFRYMYSEDIIIKNLEDVFLANELYHKSESIGFPLIQLKRATREGFNHLGKEFSLLTEKETELKNKHCCFGHYYLYLIYKALENKGYDIKNKTEGYFKENLIDKIFFKNDGTRLIINADAGM